jgi:SSS family solute:Na+ symporter
MPTQFAILDWMILLAYFVATMGVGIYFYFRGHSVEGFTAANRSLPGLALGLSMFGSYVSSISFLANPGVAYAGNWNMFVFSLATPLAAAIAVYWIVPFYRSTGEISAYEHFEHRFGLWARTYSVVSFLLLQVARMGTVIYLLSLAMAPITGWKMQWIILVTGGAMTLYTFLGGIGAVVWTGVLQSAILISGVLICLLAVIFRAPDALAGIVSEGVAHDKFSLGDFGGSLSNQTFWVVLAYGIATNIGNFAVDQSYVQRYITARSDREAAKSVWITASLYVPVAGIFFFIGTGLHVFYSAHPELLKSGMKLDEVLPYFISTQLPVGLAGIVIAAVFAAAMDSNLNSMATLTYCDLYKRYLRPSAGEREGLIILRLGTLFWGIGSVCVAFAMIQSKSALDAWWQVAGILSGGILGLFLLGRLCPKANSSAGLAGLTVGIFVITWMTFSPAYFGRVTAGATISDTSRQSLVLEKAVSNVSAGDVVHLHYSSIDPETNRESTIHDTRKVLSLGNDGRAIELAEPLANPAIGKIAVYDDSAWYHWRSPFHPYLTIVAGTCTVLIVGAIVSAFRSSRSTNGVSAPSEP